MSNIGVHDFAIPHDQANPTRDMIIIRMPLPPKKIGSLHMPDMARDMAKHNVMAGRIVKLGPLAFAYKDADGLQKQDANIGDWVVIRPFAGTMIQGGTHQELAGWRYVSSFADVIAVLPADKMPDPATLLWDEEPSQQGTEGGAVMLETALDVPVADNVRERTVYKKNHGGI